MTLITIEVTEEHIKNGQRMRCRYCPVALAISSSINPEVIVEVVSWEIELHKDLTHFSIDTSPEVEQFIKNFDSYDPDLPACFQPKPFSFQLDIPQEYLK